MRTPMEPVTVEALAKTRLPAMLTIRPPEAAVLPILRTLRGEEIASEIYPDAGKMKKQMEYANRRNIPYVVIIGSNEIAEGKATVKNMRSGEQKNVAMAELADELK